MTRHGRKAAEGLGGPGGQRRQQALHLCVRWWEAASVHWKAWPVPLPFQSVLGNAPEGHVTKHAVPLRGGAQALGTGCAPGCAVLRGPGQEEPVVGLLGVPRPLKQVRPPHMQCMRSVQGRGRWGWQCTIGQRTVSTREVNRAFPRTCSTAGNRRDLRPLCRPCAGRPIISDLMCVPCALSSPGATRTLDANLIPCTIRSPICPARPQVQPCRWWWLLQRHTQEILSCLPMAFLPLHPSLLLLHPPLYPLAGGLRGRPKPQEAGGLQPRSPLRLPLPRGLRGGI
mmetsp:Transcript_101888/g.175848  ORF Transcript_101888/g.175848 Transcript_101888/m.175848 type:complete len:284 (-) Transcript_101888:342-1193(-)